MADGKRFEGFGAIVTGGGTGVGRETALELAKRGANVAINYSRSEQEAHATAKEIEALGVRCFAVQADVAEDGNCRSFVEQAVREFSRLDILVNNAGVTEFIPHADLDSVTPEIWARLYAVNVIGPFQMIRAAKPALTEAKGQVVNVASVAGLSAMGSSIPYCASKAALVNLTVSLARVLAPAVRVNAVAPGFITGRWLERGLGAAYEHVKTSFEGRAALQRVCDPIDVANAILSLLEGSELITGQTIVCDGGMMIGASTSL